MSSRIRPLCALLAALGAWTAPAIADEGIDLLDLQGDGALSFASNDGLNVIVVGGRMMLDTAFYTGGYNRLGNGLSSESEVRRARLGADGVIEGGWMYQFEIDVRDDEEEASVDTAFVGYTGWEAPNLSLGRFKRPVGLEVLTSSKWISTMERALIFDVVPHNNSAQFGVMLDQAFGPGHWYLGLFDAGVEDLDTGLDQYGVYGRVTWAQIGGSDQLWHLGLSLADQLASDRTQTTVSSRFGLHSLPADSFQLANQLDPGRRERSAAINVSTDRQAGLEAAWLSGDLSVQGEWLMRRIEREFDGALTVSGGYLQLAWTLAGERRLYKPGTGAFGRVPPPPRGGSWELVAKLDHVRADAARVSMLTLGANYTPNWNSRLMLNLLHYNSENLAAGDAFDSQGTALMTRLQFHF